MKARIIKESGDAIVFYNTKREFPCVNSGMIMSYIRVGQHGEASIAFMRENTRSPRNKAERALCASLKAEIRSL